MKKAMIILMAFTTFAITAQNKNSEKREHRKEMKENFTPEQKAELRAKKMTLDLGLNDSQQTKVKQLFVEMEKNKPARPENKSEMTDAQKFEAKSAMLDRQIAMKKQLKEILTEEQLTKWEKSRHHKRDNMKRKNSPDKPRRD
ncbi:hypothetical protein A7A78_14040 [Aequorivita soesokkakensis]|jgi:hypothetical protein|uniref:DUF4890 domain-containing protein n=1 Tax=Aequorivita soesokkakensis TaxID=1385699 RepID=A0A1A9LCX2_9FLAO|nr:hypothetical protein [Aequorivita soesokkakensis]OAD90826.1 hypothetical protein A7A78_14040 [Aequorivita soesokkakensis]